jgi:hypothetical protein
MKTLILSLLICFFPFSGNAYNDLDRHLQKFYVENKVKGDPTKVDDHTWLKRTYLTVAGRIPTLSETQEFIKNKEPVKKNKIVEKLLHSEDYVNNLYNFWADIFRIRPERLSDGTGILKAYPYMDYVRDSIRADKPYDKFIFDLLTATGKYSDNGATGYMLRDTGMPLDNLATTLQLFIATDLSCAQCHDDPFQEYTQRQFFEMAAFFNTLDNRESRKEYGDILKKVDQEIKEITKQDRIDNNVRQLLSANLFNLKDNDAKEMKLPHDYKYSDAKPFDVVKPLTLDSKLKVVDSNKREELSKWIVEHENFSLAVSNRIWGLIVGTPLISPETSFVLTDYNTGSVLKYLGDYLKAHGYSIKELIRHIIESDFYNRVAYTGPTTLYNFQSVQIQRLPSYQIWDNILTLVIPDTNYSKIVFDEYSNLIEIDWNNVSGKGLLEKMETIRAYDSNITKNTLKYKNIDLIRSAFIVNRNSFVGQFLREYGSSDRILIDSTDNKGSITQILMLMNSPLFELVTSKESIISSMSKEEIFSTVLTRNPNIEERAIINKTEKNDLIWALINSREFLFKK